MGKSAIYPKPTLRLKKGAWRIRWSANYKDYEFAAGLGEADAEAAETMRAEVELALRTGKWPEWAESVETIRKWRGICDEPEFGDSVRKSSDMLDEWSNHYAASARAEQVALRVDQIKALAIGHA